VTDTADIMDKARSLLDLCRNTGLTLGAVESCTGGMICAALTAIPGSSDVVMGGLVTYSNKAKSELAGVTTDLIMAHGAVSEPVARAMAEGGRLRLGVDICVSITGVAGPGGGSAEKPVGLVWFAVAGPQGTGSGAMRFGEIGRDGVRQCSVNHALDLVTQAVIRP
jgi:nicotinamide-nucleotide amidase